MIGLNLNTQLASEPTIELGCKPPARCHDIREGTLHHDDHLSTVASAFQFTLKPLATRADTGSHVPWGLALYHRPERVAGQTEIACLQSSALEGPS
jgi:hypothetical protein